MQLLTGEPTDVLVHRPTVDQHAERAPGGARLQHFRIQFPHQRMLGAVRGDHPYWQIVVLSDALDHVLFEAIKKVELTLQLQVADDRVPLVTSSLLRFEYLLGALVRARPDAIADVVWADRDATISENVYDALRVALDVRPARYGCELIGSIQNILNKKMPSQRDTGVNRRGASARHFVQARQRKLI